MYIYVYNHISTYIYIYIHVCRQQRFIWLQLFLSDDLDSWHFGFASNSLTQQHPSRLTFSHLPGRVANPFTPDASRTKTFGKRWTVEARMPRCSGWRGFNMNEHGRWGRENNKTSKFGTFIKCFFFQVPWNFRNALFYIWRERASRNGGCLSLLSFMRLSLVFCGLRFETTRFGDDFGAGVSPCIYLANLRVIRLSLALIYP